jgi:hypothetical protein
MPKQPLLVQLLFHPESAEARRLAKFIHHHLNDDLVVPGLRIPTVFSPFDESAQPLADHGLDFAEHTFVAVLADDQLVTADEWTSHAADVWSACRHSAHRCVPVQLSPNAWPLDDRLNQVSFIKAFLQTDEQRDAFVVRRLAVELCRFLSDLPAKGDDTPAPVKLFLSHAKADLAAEPKVALRLIDALKEDQPIEAWVDSGDILAGASFADEIEKGVEKTSLLVVLTDNYATREWCREEVLLAKEHQRPIAVIDALSKYEARTFPYLGNVPRLRWDGDPQPGIDLVLKETLRHLHAEAILRRQKQPGDIVFQRPPELATLVGLDRGTSVLYPEPPVGAGEARRLARTGVTVATPLQRLSEQEPFTGKLIALSMSESTDIGRNGFDEIHLDAAMAEISRYLLIKGATLAYGGHLGKEGYTQQLFEIVRTHNNVDGVKPFERIVNHRGWPLPKLDVKARAALKQTSRTIELPRPADLDESLHPDFIANPAFFSSAKSAAHRFAWARGMTEMRKLQVDKANGVVARIVLGGTFGPTPKVAEDGTKSTTWYSGRIPGVLEEVLLSAIAGQPVFLIGAFGGAAALAIDLLQGKHRPEATWEYQKQAPFAVEMRELYERRGLEWLDYPEITALMQRKGVAGINPLLTEAEHLELFRTVDPFRMVETILQGLNRLQ